MQRFRPRWWAIIFTLVATLTAGCSSLGTSELSQGGTKSELRVWETPAPSPPDTTLLNSGDVNKRPVFHRIEISHFGVKNGWHIAPWQNYKLMVEVEGADEVYFQAFDPGEAPNPDRDGYLHSREYSPLEHPGDDPHLWAIGGVSNGGQTAGFYAVAENEHGQTISAVLFVAWNSEYSGYSEQDLKEPF